MGLRFPGQKREAEPAPARGDDDGDDGDVTAGEDLYVVLVEALKQATIAEKMEIAAAFEAAATGTAKDWSALSQGVRDLFDAAGEAYDEAAAIE